MTAQTGKSSTETCAVRRTPQPSQSLPRLAPARTEGIVLRSERPWSSAAILATQMGIVVAILGLWEIGVRAGYISQFFWSKPSDIATTMFVFMTQGTAWIDTWFTFRATIFGFVAGSLLGAVIGLTLWWSENLARVAEPFIVVFNAIPKMALGPLIILLFGIGIASKIALAIALTFVITALAAFAGVKAVDRDLVKLTYTLGGRKRDVFLKVVLPSTIPWIISSLRINIGLALAGVLLGEFISSQYGLGKVILYAGATYDIALIWAGITILAALSMLLYGAVVWLERQLLKGFHSSGTTPPPGA
jgi:NitT/TauT family transport system permease protein